MAFLEVKGIRKAFPGVVALDHVDLSVELGTVHVLAGENGAGKSTLIRALTGIMEVDEGTIHIDGRDAHADRSLFDLVAYVPQELNLFPHMTVAENLFMPFSKSGFGGAVLSRSELNRAAVPYLERFDIHARPDQPVATIAVSDRQLLQIARAGTRRAFKVLILDEPTTSLTSREIGRLLGIVRRLRDDGHAVVFVSHKMDEVFDIGTNVTVLRNGTTVGHHRMSDIDEPQLIRMMSGDEVRLDQTFQPDCAVGEPVLEVEHLSGRRFHDVSFTLRRGEILGFAGLIGAGRTELMQGMFGYTRPSGGRVAIAGRPYHLGSPAAAVAAGMVYLSEDRQLYGILPALSVRENIGISILDQICRNGVVSATAERTAVAGVIDAYDIKTPSAEKKIMFLSGGNQQKTIIGRAMARRPKILIFDEPTRGIDVRNKVEIYKIMKKLAEDGVGIILVSSEIAELKRCATRILTMHYGSLTGSFDARTTDANRLVGAMIGAMPGSGENSHVA